MLFVRYESSWCYKCKQYSPRAVPVDVGKLANKICWIFAQLIIRIVITRIAIIGEYKAPLPEAVYLIEKIVKYQIESVVSFELVYFWVIEFNIKHVCCKIKSAESISDLRGSHSIELEDFIFLFRNDRVTESSSFKIWFLVLMINRHDVR